MLLDIDFEHLTIVRYIPPLTNSLYQVLSPRGYLTATYFTVLLPVYHVATVLNPFKALPCVCWQCSYQIGTGREGRTRLHYRLLRRVSLRFTFWSWRENNIRTVRPTSYHSTLGTKRCAKSFDVCLPTGEKFPPAILCSQRGVLQSVEKFLGLWT